jgi:hypothetical protein
VLKHLNELGSNKVFAAFEAILTKPKKSGDVPNVLEVLRQLKGDRRRFIEYAVRALADSNEEVRYLAVELLGDIGTIAEASPVVALLSDDCERAVTSAARMLAVIGGPRELQALDVWLLGPSHRGDGELRKRVQQCRDDLKKRLDKDSAK